jgi:hypothetical protein
VSTARIAFLASLIISLLHFLVEAIKLGKSDDWSLADL